jgi:hypothetical protein
MTVLQPGRRDRRTDRLRSCRSGGLARVATPAPSRRPDAPQDGPVDCGLSDPCPMSTTTARVPLDPHAIALSSGRSPGRNGSRALLLFAVGTSVDGIVGKVRTGHEGGGVCAQIVMAAARIEIALALLWDWIGTRPRSRPSDATPVQRRTIPSNATRHKMWGEMWVKKSFGGKPPSQQRLA